MQDTQIINGLSEILDRSISALDDKDVQLILAAKQAILRNEGERIRKSLEDRLKSWGISDVQVITAPNFVCWQFVKVTGSNSKDLYFAHSHEAAEAFIIGMSYGRD